MIYDESKTIEDGFAQSLDRVNVTIERKKQWFLINPPIKVIIDDDMSYIFRASSSVVVPMAPGMHKFHFIGLLRSKELETDVQNDSNIVLKWNHVWGTLPRKSLFAKLLHIGLTVVVYYGVVTAKKICLPVAIILHMLMDTFPALYQRSVVPLWTVELWAGVWTGAVVFVAVNLYRKMKESSSSESI